MSTLPAKVDKFHRKNGRPTDLNAEVAYMICEMVKLGTTYEVAARAAGISARTFQNWKQRAKQEPESIYAEFLQNLEMAEAQGEVVHLSTVSKAGPDGAKWILAARHPERYAPSTRVNILVREELDSALATLEAGLTEGEYEKVLAILAQRTGR